MTTFPLRLVPFERYMLADDRPSHPMAFQIRLRFSGRFDPALFAGAVDQAVERHPLLRARVVVEGPKKPVWKLADSPRPWIDIGPLGEPCRFPGREQIDLRSENGVRIWVRHSDDVTEWRFQFHHVCCDGVGAYRFIEDILCAYELAVHPGVNAAQVRPLDAERLRQRTRCGLSWPRLLLRTPIEIWGVVGGLATFYLKRPVELAKDDSQDEDGSRSTLVSKRSDVSGDNSQGGIDLLDMPAHHFDEPQTRRLREIAKEAGATFNDLFLRELLLGMHAWNSRRAPKNNGRMLRIMVPMNARASEDELLPAANVVGMAFVDRRPAWHRNTRFLLKTITWETRFLKTLRLSLSFMRCCALLDALPGGLRFMSSTKRCQATSVLSNMGKLFPDAKLPRREGKLTAGDLTLEAVESAPPVRPATSTSFTSLAYGNRSSLIMNYDRWWFTSEAARELMATIVGQILATIEGKAPA